MVIREWCEARVCVASCTDGGDRLRPDTTRPIHFTHAQGTHSPHIAPGAHCAPQPLSPACAGLALMELRLTSSGSYSDSMIMSRKMAPLELVTSRNFWKSELRFAVRNVFVVLSSFSAMRP